MSTCLNVEKSIRVSKLGALCVFSKQTMYTFIFPHMKTLNTARSAKSIPRFFSQFSQNRLKYAK